MVRFFLVLRIIQIGGRDRRLLGQKKVFEEQVVKKKIVLAFFEDI